MTSDVAVIGAGVAGLAAALALAKDGAAVTLLERRPFVGGRAYSYAHPALGETIDSQHVILGCCTNFTDLIAQAGASDTIRWYDDLCFLEPTPSGTPRQSWLRTAPLPAPSHKTLSFLSAPMLTWRDKTAIARGLMHFLRGYPATDEESFATWLKRTGQTERAICHFWEPVIVGALNDTFDRCSTKYAGKVFHESFLRSAEAGRMGIPAAPLSAFFQPILDLARNLGVDMRPNSSVESFTPQPDGTWAITTRAGQINTASVILATGFRQTQELLRPLGPAIYFEFDKFIAAPITTIHLWYDREVTDLDHAVLLDTRVQWMFAKSRIRRWPVEQGSYLELVISASWPEIEMSREDILASALRETELFFPRIRGAKLLKSSVLKEARATFSVTPGLDQYRPQQRTGLPGLYIAGDWTATEWPSTMEGAIRSGRLAAGELTGTRTRFLSQELPATGPMRWLSTIPET
ncbi:MAG TPA: hydroxysqualene dehydroxylase HpnE [Acidobacteriaceae bacterium]|jgi:zeta-carotene desaturase|nr:hydroxysqualene dehydroxylase HpnE [Acidobacteriaceae bacterium]